MPITQSHNTGSMWKQHFPRHHILAACLISIAVAGTLAILPTSDVVAYRPATIAAVEPAPQVDTPATQAIADTAADTTTGQTAAAATIAVAEPDPWTHLTVDNGDTLSDLLQSNGLSANDVHTIINSNKDARELTKLSLGDQLDILIKDGKLAEMRLQRSKLESIAVKRNNDDGYEVKLINHTPEVRQAFASGTIESSLFLASHKAGLSDRLTLKLADIFAYDIDFMQDLQDGDRFSVLYEELYLDGQRVGEGKILAAEFVNQGKAYRAVQYSNKDGSVSYYTPDGEIMRKQFLRTPVDFARITSTFSLNRMHPILHKIRAHKGVDYAAPRGTPIRAAGDGTVVFAGVRNGFGNVVMIQHGSIYTTVYGHMDRISTHNGARVSQGQAIGTVGMTGLATAPHLHYEFHVNGVAQNPLANTNVAMAEPISKAEKARFNNAVSPLLSQLSQRIAGNGQTATNVTLAKDGNAGNTRVQ